MNNLGNCYYLGHDVKLDYKIAVDWYRKSADLNNYRAMNNLGECYYLGHSIDKDYKIAVDWFRKSADLGDSIATKNLGNCYYLGHGVDKDIITAVKWYGMAVNKGNKNAIDIMAIICVNDIIEHIIEIKMINEHLEEINEHLKLFPGSDYKKVEANFLHLCSM